MPAFVFVGDAGEGPEHVTLFGYAFELNGAAVQVDDPAAIAKFRGNRHFGEVADGADANLPAPSAQPKRRGRPPKDRT